MAADVERDGFAAAAEAIDLEAIPLSLPGSRIVVRRSATGLEIAEAIYEVDLDASTFVRSLILIDRQSRPVEISEVRPDRIIFGPGRATLAFAGPTAVSVGGDDDVAVSFTAADGSAQQYQLGESAVLFRADRPAQLHSVRHHEAATASSADEWKRWMAKCPTVRSDLAAMARLCWYVLGVNTIELGPEGNRRPAVVPSMIGYVGLWQWDAYFIAVGLRHGDLDLARIQIEIALDQAGPDGQLPDVVHDNGVLMTSRDLPPTDLVALARHCPAAVQPGQTVALTKPPLSAWAIAKVAAAADRTPGASTVLPAAWRAEMFAIAAASQTWWFRAADCDGDGMPEYAHPYSSGLDDSPIFDNGVPVRSPDLASYLVLQDAILERWGPTSATAVHRQRQVETMQRLLELWDADLGRFVAVVDGRPRVTDAITGLMPLLTGALPASIVEVLVDAISSPDRFGTAWPIPTVAAGDADFSPTQMWRGPTWVNTNYLIIEGLIASGRTAEAERLAESTVAMIVHAGGPHEYFDPHTGRKPATATTAFGWSAALFIDIAVRLSAGELCEGVE